MSEEFGTDTALGAVFARALDARDPRFDGVFFVGITSTGIYCRSICPARVSYPERRRFFPSAAAAERAGYRPCLRCRPELAPGRAPCDAVSRLARAAASRIAAGALNGRGVADLAGELGVGERHLRRVLEREMGVSPIELALTYRLLFARRLLANTRLSVTRIAYASGFQSLRRFNAAFRERYRSSPSELRRPPARAGIGRDDFVRLSLAYRPPLHWSAMLQVLQRDAVRGVDAVDGDRYMSVVRVDGHVGAIVARDAASDARAAGPARHYVIVDVTPSLLPRLMPVLARVRQLFDLDAEPTLIDAHLAQSGLGRLVGAHPGIRVPGALDAFDVALRVLLRRASRSQTAYESLAWRITAALGATFDVGLPGLHHLAPEPGHVGEASVQTLTSLGVRERWAAIIIELARAVAAGRLRLEPGSDPSDISRELAAIGVDEASVAHILARTAAWPDSFSAHDLTSSATEWRSLVQRAERWRPWRAYAAMHLRLHGANVARDVAHSRAG
jgi:AraC family transcriptional regulator, regulatory protein of adaptative response / DNA-3-methyladenine glycosylase II